MGFWRSIISECARSESSFITCVCEEKKQECECGGRGHSTNLLCLATVLAVTVMAPTIGRRVIPTSFTATPHPASRRLLAEICGQQNNLNDRLASFVGDVKAGMSSATRHESLEMKKKEYQRDLIADT
ncbi:hypothetical protein RRG08_035750 [Elysia crispata]|uniref:Uncharacterized protein n=1 Tax=Elysia crispata TaxID=231223 RepID=A0AAE0ZLI6_9GAST|nr:hypothetical protein RRG08_035750 [Elysia crispata]